MAKLELFGTASCPHTDEMREWLEFRGCEFEEYDVEHDAAAYTRMVELSGGQRMVPVLIEDGKLVQSGWQGRGCVVGGHA
jgi:mycoredoxin